MALAGSKGCSGGGSEALGGALAWVALWPGWQMRDGRAGLRCSTFEAWDCGNCDAEPAYNYCRCMIAELAYDAQRLRLRMADAR